MTTIRGPNRSTNQPSTGTSHVSVATKIVNATWMLVRPQWNRASIGSTKYVHPYWRLAIITMQMTPATSCSHRLTGRGVLGAGSFAMAGKLSASLRPDAVFTESASRIQVAHHDAEHLGGDACVALGDRRDERHVAVGARRWRQTRAAITDEPGLRSGRNALAEGP